MSTPLDTDNLHAWAPGPEHPRARHDEVHVWRATLARPEPEVEALRSLLSADELARANGFRFNRHRDDFIVARGTLRTILGRYLRRPPARLRFNYNKYGKPELRGAEDEEPLRFNASHAGGIALYAVARGREVGVDVERVRDDLACDEVAGRFFSRREVETLRALPASQRTEGFFNCWTRKEAYIKALGKGLSLPLDRFDVSLAPGEPAILLGVRGDEHGHARWYLRELLPGFGCVAAIAVEGDDWRLSCWRWGA